MRPEFIKVSSCKLYRIPEPPRRRRIPPAGVAHQDGTMRLGKDPRTSVLDLNCKTHDVDNSYMGHVIEIEEISRSTP